MYGNGGKLLKTNQKVTNPIKTSITVNSEFVLFGNKT